LESTANKRQGFLPEFYEKEFHTMMSRVEKGVTGSRRGSGGTFLASFKCGKGIYRNIVLWVISGFSPAFVPRTTAAGKKGITHAID